MAPPASSLAERFPAALVTGASSGIGAAIANQLLREGIRVYGTTRNPDIQGLDANIQWLAFDGSSAAGISVFLSSNAELLSGINLLINNAGSSCFGEVTEITEKEHSEQICLLLDAPVHLSRRALPTLRKNNGCLVNVSSLAALFPMPHMPAYTAGKAGLSGFTQSLLLTENPDQVQVIDFQPGDFRTPFNRNQAPEHQLNRSEETVWKAVEAHLERAPGPEVAAADLLRAIKKGKSGIVRSGGFFQKHLAPLGLRLLPQKVLLSAIRRYYRIPKK